MSAPAEHADPGPHRPSPRRSPSRAPSAAAEPRWLVPAALAVAAVALAKAPAIDEESYLWIGAHLNPLRPYDWTRVWAPYDAPDAYVYAHPPLHLLQMWVATPLVEGAGVWAARAIFGLPWVALLAWSVARLCALTTHHPQLAAAAWLSSTVVVLGLQDSLMIDLPATALVTFTVAAYRSALQDGAGRRWFPAAGLALGAALATKYSTGAVVPVLAVHLARGAPHGDGRRSPLADRAAFVVSAAALFLIVEGWLWAAYGRPHLLEVWGRRGEIAAGGLAERAVGTLSRMALLPIPAALAVSAPAVSAVGAAAGMLTLVAAQPVLDADRLALLLVLTAAGGALLARGLSAALRGPFRRRKGDRDDALLLGGWLVCGVVGVVFVHNYASARYLLPIAAPAAILIARSAEEVRFGKLALQLGVGVAAVLTLALASADYAYVRAGTAVARMALAEAERLEGAASAPLTRGAAVGSVDPGGVAGGGSPPPQNPPEAPLRRFAGEWSFRWAMEPADGGRWQRYRPGEELPTGTIVVVADNASPGDVPTDDWEPVSRVESASRFPVRVVDAKRHVSLYAETLGALPFGWARGPIEGATLYRTR